jgi:hypothetical protein
MVSSGTFFFVAVSLQTTLGYRPLVAGLALMPLYIVMTLGAPLSGRLADRIGPRTPTLVGLAVYGIGVWMLSGIGSGSGLLSDVLPGLIVMAVGAATFATPLTTATLGALDETDQGVASGVNNAVGQLAGLLAIAVLPAAAGLTDATVGGPAFASGHTLALRISTASWSPSRSWPQRRSGDLQTGWRPAGLSTYALLNDAGCESADGVRPEHQDSRIGDCRRTEFHCDVVQAWVEGHELAAEFPNGSIGGEGNAAMAPDRVPHRARVRPRGDLGAEVRSEEGSVRRVALLADR